MNDENFEYDKMFKFYIRKKNDLYSFKTTITTNKFYFVVKKKTSPKKEIFSEKFDLNKYINYKYFTCVDDFVGFIFKIAKDDGFHLKESSNKDKVTLNLNNLLIPLRKGTQGIQPSEKKNINEYEIQNFGINEKYKPKEMQQNYNINNDYQNYYNENNQMNENNEMNENYEENKIKEKPKNNENIEDESRLKNYKNLFEQVTELKKENKDILNNYQNLKKKYDEDFLNLNDKFQTMYKELQILKERYMITKSNTTNIKFKNFNSKIINSQRNFELIYSYLPTDLQSKKLEIIYRASVNGDTPTDFHKRVDETKYPTLIIAMNRNKEIFGGFTKEIWDSSNKLKLDNDSFIFNLTNNEKYFGVKKKAGIFCNKDYGPDFGENGNALFFNEKFFENEHNGIGKHDSYLNGKRTVRGKLVELEIFKLI
jgi:hypothetical protein